MAGRPADVDALLTPSEVAALFRVDPKTVTRWAKSGKLTSIRTLGGHRRYRAEEVYRLLDGTSGTRESSPAAEFAERRAVPRPIPVRPTAPSPPVPRQLGQPQQQVRPGQRTINLSGPRIDTRR